jgi:ACR3 family arsenite efflux pump ArsB
MIALVTCFVCPMVEMFDRWDHTLQTGNDTEYTLVLLALCVGMVCALARLIVTLFRSSSSAIDTSIACNLNSSLLFMICPVALAVSESPPLISRRI